MDIFDEVPKRVLSALMDSTAQPLYFSELLEHSSCSRPQLSAVLAKLSEAEMVVREEEQGNPESLGRPLRVYYSVTETAINVVRLLAPSA